MSRESNLKRRVMAYLARRPGKAVKIGPGCGEVGTPDILYVEAGRAFFFELKTDTGKESKIQEYRRRQWRAVGAIVIVARSVDDVRAVVEPE